MQQSICAKFEPIGMQAQWKFFRCKVHCARLTPALPLQVSGKGMSPYRPYDTGNSGVHRHAVLAALVNHCNAFKIILLVLAVCARLSQAFLLVELRLQLVKHSGRCKLLDSYELVPRAFATHEGQLPQPHTEHSPQKVQRLFPRCLVRDAVRYCNAHRIRRHLYQLRLVCPAQPPTKDIKIPPGVRVKNKPITSSQAGEGGHYGQCTTKHPSENHLVPCMWVPDYENLAERGEDTFKGQEKCTLVETSMCRCVRACLGHSCSPLVI